MTATRAVAVLAVDLPSRATPPGVDPDRLRLAMVEDTYEVIAGLALVDPVLALSPGPQPAAVALTWPGTRVIEIPAAPDEAAPDGSGTLTHAVLDEMGRHKYAAGVVVAGDAPDLPGLLIGKLFRALGRADIALCPAEGGGLVALAASLPTAPWLAEVGTGLDAPDAIERFRAGAPSRRAVALGPGWHRLRTPGDLSRLDPGLEGWESTRAVLSGRAHGG